MKLDWGREPRNKLQNSYVDRAVIRSLEFLREMEGVKAEYESEEAIKRFRLVATSVLLSALEAPKDEPIEFTVSERATEWLGENGTTWKAATSVVNALAHCGFIEITNVDELEGSFTCHIKLAREQKPDRMPKREVAAIMQQVRAEAEQENKLDHSRQLDVHTWSDHPEVNTFVDEIYEAHFEGRKANVKKKHLKVVLLDLYVAWSHDPDLKIAFSRNVNDYKPKSRYNSLFISKLTIDVVDQLIEAEFVEQAIGYYDREKGRGKRSRFWPTDALIEKFKEAKFGPFDIGDHVDRESIILRDEDKDDVPYDDTDDTERMRAILKNYNTLLSNTFIDIPTLREPYIELKKDNQGKAHLLAVNQRDKFVRLNRPGIAGGFSS